MFPSRRELRLSYGARPDVQRATSKIHRSSLDLGDAPNDQTSKVIVQPEVAVREPSVSVPLFEERMVT